MGFLRDRGEPAGTRYRMREKLFAIGDDFWIENGAGERAYKVNGKALRVRETLVLENPSGDELAKIQERKLRVRDTMKGRAEPQHGCDRDEGDRQPSAGPVFGRS